MSGAAAAGAGEFGRRGCTHCAPALSSSADTVGPSGHLVLIVVRPVIGKFRRRDSGPPSVFELSRCCCCLRRVRVRFSASRELRGPNSSFPFRTVARCTTRFGGSIFVGARQKCRIVVVVVRASCPADLGRIHVSTVVARPHSTRRDRANSVVCKGDRTAVDPRR